MFINAEPRYVSHGFETFVPISRTEPLHQRLVEMTNNDVNAWSIFRPVAQFEDWDQHIDEYGNNENFQVHSLYGEYFQEGTTVAPTQVVNLPRAVTYAPAHQVQCQDYKNISTAQQTYEESAAGMNCFQRPSPMLGNDYSQLSLGRGRGSFAEFSSVRNVLKDLSHQPQSEANNSGVTQSSSTSGISQTTSYLDESSITNSSVRMANASTYSPPQSTPNNSRLTRSSDTQHSTVTAPNPQHWQGNSRSSRASHKTYEFPTSNDSLPKYAGQQFHDPWAARSGSTGAWPENSLAANTISPKMLTLNVSTTSLASSESSQGSGIALSDSNSAIGALNELGDFSGHEPLVVVEPPQSFHRPRQVLPNSGPHPRRAVPVPVVPSNDFASSLSNKKRTSTVPVPLHNSRSNSSPFARGTLATTQVTPSQKLSSNSSRHARHPSEPRRVEAEAVDPATLAHSATAAQALHHRDAKDDFLVRSKLAGMSYKDIRRKGKFTEAESTLRGRFRTLTKHKAARVRKPEWSDKDIRLLQKGVRKYGLGLESSNPKIPWKLVAEYIADHGGSYHFGNATCRKRWDDLQTE